MLTHAAAIETLVLEALGPVDGGRALRVLHPFGPLPASVQLGHVSRAEIAGALNVLLFADLLGRVPTGDAYVRELEAQGNRVYFDHGALRTIRMPDGPTGALPPGEQAFARLLEPLGYRVAGTYPLPALRMTGRAYCHSDAPVHLPQFFVSELHVDQFDEAFAATAERVFGTSRDPLAAAGSVLDELSTTGSLPLAAALDWVPRFAAAFGRHHDMPSRADYDALKAVSAEAAWIATEGNAFNHATDRVADVERLAALQRALGRPMKAAVEVSASGRVRQTAFRADEVARTFAGGERRNVPGSFYEFITREIDPQTGRVDLAFDSGNAAGIFKMTEAA